MDAIVHAADIQDRDGGVLLMATLFGMYPFLLKLYADAGYQGPKFQQGLARVCREVNVEIVRRCDTGKFVVLPKRWIVERTIAWLKPLPSPEQRLGMPQQKRVGLPALGISPAYAPTALQNLYMILDRL